MKTSKHSLFQLYLILTLLLFTACKKTEEHDPYFDNIDGQITEKKPDTLIENAKERYLSGSDEQVQDE
ncbi:MAG: hypothetical protein ACKO0Y_00915, partial [Bacteroidota bacterium]